MSNVNQADSAKQRTEALRAKQQKEESKLDAAALKSKKQIGQCIYFLPLKLLEVLMLSNTETIERRNLKDYFYRANYAVLKH